MSNNSRGSYNRMLHDYRLIKPVRQLRNLTLNEFSEYMGIDTATISKLENGHINFTTIYQDRFKTACNRLRVTNVELNSIRIMIGLKDGNGYK